MAYTRRGFKAEAKATTLAGDISSGVGTITVASGGLSTWSGISSNGPFTVTINRGQSDEDTCTGTGISGDNITGVTGVGQDHTAGATIEHTSSFTDFDEMNAHIADVTLDHHTQYPLANGTRCFRRVGSDGAVDLVKQVSGTAVLSTDTVSGATSIANGAAATPALSFISDTDTGLFRQGTNALSVATAGVERVRFTAGGGLTVNPAGTDIATSATDGMVGLPTTNGTPSAGSLLQAGGVMVYDRAAHKIWVHYGGSWRSVAVT